MIRLLAEMTAPQVADAVAAGITTLILPLGSTEQHGAHLPLATDTIRAVALAAGLGDALEDVLVAPVLPFGCSDEHTGFAGLLSLDHETLASVICDCGRRIVGWGLRRLILLSAHGGNGTASDMAVARLQIELPDLDVAVLGLSESTRKALTAIARADGIAPEQFGIHAGEGETSEVLRLRPDLVRMDRAVVGYVGSMDDIMVRLRQQGIRSVIDNGILGDPRGASASRGAVYLAAQIDGFHRTLKAQQLQNVSKRREVVTC